MAPAQDIEISDIAGVSLDSEILLSKVDATLAPSKTTTTPLGVFTYAPV